MSSLDRPLWLSCALWLVVIALAIAALLTGCAGLGVGTPVGRAIPFAVKEDSERGTCASSGYEVDIPPLATVSTIASVCARPYVARDASSSDASSSDARPSLPSVADTAAQALVRELEAEGPDGR